MYLLLEICEYRALEEECSGLSCCGVMSVDTVSCLSYASSLISYPDLLPPLRPVLCATPTTLLYLPLLALPSPAFLPTLCTPPHPCRKGIYRCPGYPPVLRARFVRPSGGQLDRTVQRQVRVRACVRLFLLLSKALEGSSYLIILSLT